MSERFDLRCPADGVYLHDYLLSRKTGQLIRGGGGGSNSNSGSSSGPHGHCVRARAEADVLSYKPIATTATNSAVSDKANQQTDNNAESSSGAGSAAGGVVIGRGRRGSGFNFRSALSAFGVSGLTSAEAAAASASSGVGGENRNDNDDDDSEDGDDNMISPATTTSPLEGGGNHNSNDAIITATTLPPPIVVEYRQHNRRMPPPPPPSANGSSSGGADFMAHLLATGSGATATGSNDYQNDYGLRHHLSLPQYNPPYASYGDRMVQSMTVAKRLRGHTGCINSIEFSHDASLLITGSDDLRVKLYDTTSWRNVATLKTEHTANIFSAIIMPFSDNKTIVSCGLDGGICVSHLEYHNYHHHNRHDGGAASAAMREVDPSTQNVSGASSSHVVHRYRFVMATKLMPIPQWGSGHIAIAGFESGDIAFIDTRMKTIAHKAALFHSHLQSSPRILSSALAASSSAFAAERIPINAIAAHPINPNIFAFASDVPMAQLCDIRYLANVSAEQCRPRCAFAEIGVQKEYFNIAAATYPSAVNPSSSSSSLPTSFRTAATTSLSGIGGIGFSESGDRLLLNYKDADLYGVEWTKLCSNPSTKFMSDDLLFGGGSGFINLQTQTLKEEDAFINCPARHQLFKTLVGAGNDDDNDDNDNDNDNESSCLAKVNPPSAVGAGNPSCASPLSNTESSGGARGGGDDDDDANEGRGKKKKRSMLVSDNNDDEEEEDDDNIADDEEGDEAEEEPIEEEEGANGEEGEEDEAADEEDHSETTVSPSQTTASTNSSSQQRSESGQSGDGDERFPEFFAEILALLNDDRDRNNSNNSNSDDAGGSGSSGGASSAVNRNTSNADRLLQLIERGRQRVMENRRRREGEGGGSSGAPAASSAGRNTSAAGFPLSSSSNPRHSNLHNESRGDTAEDRARYIVCYKGRKNRVTMFKEATFLFDDLYVATGGDDGHVYFWEAATGRLLHKLRCDKSIVNGVLYHPHVPSTLIACGIDSDAKVVKPFGNYLATSAKVYYKLKPKPSSSTSGAATLSSAVGSSDRGVAGSAGVPIVSNPPPPPTQPSSSSSPQSRHHCPHSRIVAHSNASARIEEHREALNELLSSQMDLAIDGTPFRPVATCLPEEDEENGGRRGGEQVRRNNIGSGVVATTTHHPAANPTTVLPLASTGTQSPALIEAITRMNVFRTAGRLQGFFRGGENPLPPTPQSPAINNTNTAVSTMVSDDNDNEESDNANIETLAAANTTATTTASHPSIPTATSATAAAATVNEFTLADEANHGAFYHDDHSDIVSRNAGGAAVNLGRYNSNNNNTSDDDDDEDHEDMYSDLFEEVAADEEEDEESMWVDVDDDEENAEDDDDGSSSTSSSDEEGPQLDEEGEEDSHDDDDDDDESDHDHHGNDNDGANASAGGEEASGRRDEKGHGSGSGRRASADDGEKGNSNSNNKSGNDEKQQPINADKDFEGEEGEWEGEEEHDDEEGQLDCEDDYDDEEEGGLFGGEYEEEGEHEDDFETEEDDTTATSQTAGNNNNDSGTVSRTTTAASDRRFVLLNALMTAFEKKSLFDEKMQSMQTSFRATLLGKYYPRYYLYHHHRHNNNNNATNSSNDNDDNDLETDVSPSLFSYDNVVWPCVQFTLVNTQIINQFIVNHVTNAIRLNNTKRSGNHNESGNGGDKTSKVNFLPLIQTILDERHNNALIRWLPNEVFMPSPLISFASSANTLSVPSSDRLGGGGRVGGVASPPPSASSSAAATSSSSSSATAVTSTSSSSPEFLKHLAVVKATNERYERYMPLVASSSTGEKKGKGNSGGGGGGLVTTVSASLASLAEELRQSPKTSANKNDNDTSNQLGEWEENDGDDHQQDPFFQRLLNGIDLSRGIVPQQLFKNNFHLDFQSILKDYTAIYAYLAETEEKRRHATSSNSGCVGGLKTTVRTAKAAKAAVPSKTEKNSRDDGNDAEEETKDLVASPATVVTLPTIPDAILNALSEERRRAIQRPPSSSHSSSSSSSSTSAVIIDEYLDNCKVLLEEVIRLFAVIKHKGVRCNAALTTTSSANSTPTTTLAPNNNPDNADNQQQHHSLQKFHVGLSWEEVEHGALLTPCSSSSSSSAPSIVAENNGDGSDENDDVCDGEEEESIGQKRHRRSHQHGTCEHDERASEIDDANGENERRRMRRQCQHSPPSEAPTTTAAVTAAPIPPHHHRRFANGIPRLRTIGQRLNFYTSKPLEIQQIKGLLDLLDKYLAPNVDIAGNHNLLLSSLSSSSASAQGRGGWGGGNVGTLNWGRNANIESREIRSGLIFPCCDPTKSAQLMFYYSLFVQLKLYFAVMMGRLPEIYEHLLTIKTCFFYHGGDSDHHGVVSSKTSSLHIPSLARRNDISRVIVSTVGKSKRGEKETDRNSFPKSREESDGADDGLRLERKRYNQNLKVDCVSPDAYTMTPCDIAEPILTPGTESFALDALFLKCLLLDPHYSLTNNNVESGLPEYFNPASVQRAVRFHLQRLVAAAQKSAIEEDEEMEQMKQQRQQKQQLRRRRPKTRQDIGATDPSSHDDVEDGNDSHDSDDDEDGDDDLVISSEYYYRRPLGDGSRFEAVKKMLEPFIEEGALTDIFSRATHTL